MAAYTPQSSEDPYTIDPATWMGAGATPEQADDPWSEPSPESGTTSNETPVEPTEFPSRDDSSRPALVRFLDSFLREQNIKWVLGIGALIVLGSSLMLVTAHWSHQPPVWKYLIMFGYTALIALAGHTCYHRLALVKTGTMLRSLTVMLLPVLFLALHWVQDVPLTRDALTLPPSRAGPTWINILLLGITTLFTALVAPRIFRHFLRGHQPTFVMAYILLCVAGAVTPLVSPVAMPLVGLGLWAVFAIGSVKVNRHVFWLVEEHRAPRITGFLPILLLGAQFFTLFALHIAPHVTLPWIGLGCVLVAAPVLMTADTIACVFQQRTGDLVRPLPLPIIAPLVIGLLLTLVGVVLSGVDALPAGLLLAHPKVPFALVPTAAIAASMMMLVARRTGKQPFVWAGLLGLTIAYRYSPVFFSELAAQLIRGGADLVNEPKLPIAFYGLTFLPLIAGLMIVGTVARRKANELFAAPCMWYSVGLSALMLVLSLTHAKAMMPVALAMTAVFAAETKLYRDHRLALLAIVSFITAALGVPLFLGAAFSITLSSGWSLLCVGIAAGLLLVPGFRIDRALSQLTTKPITYCRDASLAVTLLLTAVWTLGHSVLSAGFATPAFTFDWLAPTVAIGALLITHSLRTLNTSLATGTLCFIHLVIISIGAAANLDVNSIASITILALATQWLLGYVLRARPESRISQAFGHANETVSHLGLAFSLAIIIMPSLIVRMTMSTDVVLLSPWFVCYFIVIAWAFDAARRSANTILAGFAYLGIMGLAGAIAVWAFGSQMWQWLPLLWTGVAVVSLPLIKLLRRAESTGCSAIALALDHMAVTVLRLGAIVTLVAFSTPMRITGVTALAGLTFAAAILHRPGMRSSLLPLANWHAITLLIQLTSGDFVANLFELPRLAGVASLPIALAAAVSALLWQGRKPGDSAILNDLVAGHRFVLRLLAGLAILSTLTPTVHMTALSFILAGGVLLTFIISELWKACDTSSETRVWTAQVITALSIAYFVWHGLIGFQYGLSMFVVLGAGVVLGIISRFAQNRPAISVLARPFRRTATALPLVTVGIGIVRHIISAPAPWLGMNSLAILLAGGFYFWMGTQRKDRRYTVLAAAILNIALLLLWNELAFTDPQFYLIPIGITVLSLVRLLRSEIEANLREPLNYLGALIILVSPVFHIVTGSWLHLFSLMALSVVIVLGAIGFRVRPMVYTGAAFLIADLIAMVVYGTIDNPSLLWIAGIGLGAAVVTLGALAERNREQLLGRLRRVTAAIAAWE
ncbi:MAG: hypothetical protein WD768_22015 [Phycisphaeraceae bacterium]